MKQPFILPRVTSARKLSLFIRNNFNMKESLVFLICVLLFACYGTLVAPMQKCKKVVDIVMVLDESGSIGRKNFGKIKRFVKHVISRFSVAPFGAHFATVAYSSRPRQVFSLTKYTNARRLHMAVRRMRYRGGTYRRMRYRGGRMRYRGGTYTGKALKMVQKKVFGTQDDRKNVPNIVVLFSGGASHDLSKAVRVAKEMRKNGVEILCIGIGYGLTVKRLMKQLKQISSKPEYTFKITINALDTIEDSLVKDMCKTSSACASNPCKNGGQCQCLDNDNIGYQCKCSPKWEGKNCEFPKCDNLCPREPFSKRGCYRTPRPRPARLLFNRRDQIDWKGGWDNFIEKIVHDCGKEAKEKGYKFFCIEFYGECWGYEYFHVTQPHAPSNTCWGKRPNFTICDDSQKNPICVGTANHGYIYELN